MEGSNRAALTEKTLEFWIVSRLWEVGEHGGSTKDSSGYKFPGFTMFISSIIISIFHFYYLFFLPSGRQNKISTVLNLFIQNRSAQFLYIIYFLILYPKKGMQDCLGFCIPCRGFRILGTGLQSLSVELKIPDTNCQWDSRFLEPYSRFQSPGFYISPLEIPGCLIPEFPGFWNLD